MYMLTYSILKLLCHAYTADLLPGPNRTLHYISKTIYIYTVYIYIATYLPHCSRHVCQIMEFLYSFFTSPFGDKREAKQFPELPWGKMRRPRPRLHPRGRQGMGHLLQWCPGSENKKDIFKKPGLGLIVDNG